MITKSLITTVAAAGLFLLTALPAHAERLKENINRDWKFNLGDVSGAEATDFNDGAWLDANLPHTFSLPYFMWKDVYHGYGWYRRTLTVPADWQGKEVCVEFEGAFIQAEVYVNGQLAGTHTGGYTGFSFDITKLIHTGENSLAVRVNNIWKANVAPRAGDHQFSGGIYRDVYLTVTDPLHVDYCGTFIQTPEVSSTAATCKASTAIVNSGSATKAFTLTTNILDPAGNKVATVSTDATAKAGQTVTVDQTLPQISSPQLWSPSSPNRYTAVTTVVSDGKTVDTYCTRFGIRSLSWTADQGFFLNGEHLFLLGANVHQDQAGWGDAVTNGAIVRDVQMIKDAGFNCIRASHYPHDPAFAEACDSLGVLLFMETPFWGMGGNKDEVVWGEGSPASAYPTNTSDQKAFNQSVLAQLKEMIRIHRNSPSIAAWSLCNEPFFTASSTETPMKALLDEETDSATRWDPTRQVAIGGSQRKGIDKLGKNQIAFYNGDGASMSDFQNPGVPNMVSEYGSTTANRPGSFAPGWGNVGDGMTNRPAWRSGQVIWCGFDHGTVGGTTLASMGIIDYFRLPKRSYYWYQQAYAEGKESPVEPTWPQAGTATQLKLFATETTIKSDDGTDDAQIIVRICDAQGTQLSNTQAVTLEVVSGPGEFPTGKKITFYPPSSDQKSDIVIRDGEAAIAFRSYYSGTTVIRATADGLASDEITLTTLGTHPFGADTKETEDRPYKRFNAADTVTTVMEESNFTLAAQRPTQASSEKTSASLANDENTSTAWTPTDADIARWWRLDLEASYNVNRIELTFPTADNYKYIIEVSDDGETWRTAVDESDNTSTLQKRIAVGTFGNSVAFVRVRFTTALAGLAEVRVGGSTKPSTLGDGFLAGTVIGTAGSWKNNADVTMEKAIDFDGDTFFDGPWGGSPFWVGLDLGKDKTSNVTKVRYMPRYVPNNDKFADRMVGGQIQVASAADFSDAKTVGTITVRPPYKQFSTLLCTDTITRGRYVRYLSTDNGNGNVAEIYFYSVPPTDEELANVPDTLAATLSEYAVAGSTTYKPTEPMTLWYRQPVTAMYADNIWMDYALPIGNGQLGGMVYGGIHQDMVQFNEKTLWQGSSTSRGAYQNFGNLYLEDISGNATEGVTDYYRTLDLSNATATAHWKVGTVSYDRQYIASFPDKVIAVRLTASEPGKISQHFYLFNDHGNRPLYKDGTATIKGKLTTVSYNARLRVVPEGGELTTDATGIYVRGADAITVYLAAGTDFDPVASGYVKGTKHIADTMATRTDAAAAKGWTDLYADHVADYQSLYGRMSLSLGGADNKMPTNEFVDRYANSQGEDAYRLLEELYYQYGRYMLIASSRGIDSPNNLQGIWNNSNSPAWQCDIHANINIQMNYWPAEVTNLSETHMNFLNYLYNMAIKQPQWHSYVTDRLGQTKGWTCFTENNIFGHCSTWGNQYVVANAWNCTHLWQHYRYTLDKEFLQNTALPVMVGAVDFWMERLVKADDGTWECPDEYSPEHGPEKENAVPHAQQLVWSLFDETLKGIDIVGVENSGVDQAWVDSVKAKFANLDKGLHLETYEGNYGNQFRGVAKGDTILREWKYTNYATGNGAENNHRHMSHLMSLYPLSLVSSSSPYFEPTIRSLMLRGNESQGWSMAWKIALWARAHRGDQCQDIFNYAFKHAQSYVVNMRSWAGGVYYNLFDAHTPFQIDGNLGATAAMAEMLLQSYTDTLQLLPALAPRWTSGEAKGLRAVNQFEVDQQWADSKLTRAVVHSHAGKPCAVEYAGLGKATVTDASGATVNVTVVNDSTISFPTVEGGVYTITPYDATGIRTVSSTVQQGDGKTYNLAGQRVDDRYYGIVVRKGKKFVNK